MPTARISGQTGPREDRPARGKYVPCPIRGSSGQGVLHATDWLDLVGEYSMTRNVVFQAAPLVNVDVTATRDAAAGVTLRLPNSSLVRVEYHETRGFAFDRLARCVAQWRPAQR